MPPYHRRLLLSVEVLGPVADWLNTPLPLGGRSRRTEDTPDVEPTVLAKSNMIPRLLAA